MNRIPIVAANWKMNLDLQSGIDLVAQLIQHYEPLDDPGVDVIIAPSAVHLHAVGEMTEAIDFISTCAQTVSTHHQGAYTGEISADMVASAGADWTLVGHSERRMYHGEDAPSLNAQIDRAFDAGLRVIACVGESEEEYNAGQTNPVISKQLSELLHGRPSSELDQLVIAYEPIWAIGTGNTATPELANEIHGMIRAWIEREYSADTAAATRILYGGSCKPSNAAALFSQPHIDGGLIGGASLDATSFLALIEAAQHEI